jgi:hypothetical protein
VAIEFTYDGVLYEIPARNCQVGEYIELPDGTGLMIVSLERSPTRITEVVESAIYPPAHKAQVVGGKRHRRQL